jgi:hypothetical protein
MDTKKELVEVDEGDIGLDRSNITHQNQIQIPRLDENSGNHADHAQPEAHSSSKLVNTLKDRKHHAAVKIRKTLHISKATDDLSSQSPVLANTTDEQSDSRLVHQLPIPDKPTLKDFMHNPVETVKSKVSDQGNQQVAANIAAKEIPHGEEVDLINAHDAVSRARTENEKLMAIQDVKRLMKERQSTYARWTLDRHVTHIRVLPRDTMVRKPQTEFQKKDVHGQIVTDWNAYRNHVGDTIVVHDFSLANTISCWFTMRTSTEVSFDKPYGHEGDELIRSRKDNILVMALTHPSPQKKRLCQISSV